jgi:hypothetical protein
MPRCRVDYEIGDKWDKDNKSYSSYNICYRAQDVRLDAERPKLHPLEVKAGMGINLQPSASDNTFPTDRLPIYSRVQKNRFHKFLS